MASMLHTRYRERQKFHLPFLQLALLRLAETKNNAVRDTYKYYTTSRGTAERKMGNNYSGSATAARDDCKSGFALRNSIIFDFFKQFIRAALKKTQKQSIMKI